MKELKRNIALMLALCMVFTGIVPAYADEVTLPEQSLVREETENAEILHTQEAISDTVVPETDKDMNSDEASSDDISYEDETILEGIKNATPANADYVEPEEAQEDTDIDAFEEATPANAEYMDEEFIRETVVDGIKITLTADPGVFPEDAELWAEKVEDEATEEAIEEALEKERENDVNVAASYKFDIKVFVNGEEVQPDTSKGSVKVTFTLAEELSECLDANAYHLKEDAKGKLTAENLGAEVKTVEEADEEETAKETNNSYKTGTAVAVDEDGVLEDGTIEDDVTKKVTKLEADTDGFSYYVVEFTYAPFEYTLVGTSTKLSHILSTLGIMGTPSEATVSNAEYLEVTEDVDGEDWTVNVLQSFVSATMRVTIDSNQEYEISVSNALDGVTKQTIKYIDENGAEKSHECVIMTSVNAYTFENDGWYAVKSDITVNNRIINNAAADNPSHLILVDGATLTAPKGINIAEGKSLCIYGQTNQSGKLNVTDPDKNNSGIGSSYQESGGSIIINGGTITVTGGYWGAGIGTGYHGGHFDLRAGSITINGGTVTATGGEDGAGIGGGHGYSGGSIIINGGTVTATGGPDGAGIGGGVWQSGGSITINGGTVTATGEKGGAGIGGGYSGAGGTITINRGNVTATGGSFLDAQYGGAGIGGGYSGAGETITINDGNITAQGGFDASGIGLGARATSGNVTINGGTINAYGGEKGGRGIGDGVRNIKSYLMIYAGNSPETAKRPKKEEEIGAKYIFISDACAEVEYKVYHKRQKADPSEYEEPETETLYGGVGWKTEAIAKNYDRFTAQEFSQETIASDGTTAINILYNRNTYTITFDMNGRGTSPEPIKAGWGASIDAPQVPECEGYWFKGWYTERACTGNPYTFSTMPLEDLTLYAKWEVDPSQRQNVQYVDEDGNTKEVPCIILSEDKGAYAFDTGEWYAVTGSVAIDNRIENRASKDSPAHLILTDGASFAVKGGIHIPNDKGLVIYGQSIGSGSLSISDVQGDNDGIGGRIPEIGGEITINGGTVTSTGGWGRAGIGGKITINGGTVTATGAGGGAGIGGPWYGQGGDEITINGGTITATGAGGAAIGAGNSGAGWTLVFGIYPAVLKAGPDKDNASDVDVDEYENNHQNYGFVTMNYATASYTVEHWKQKTVRGEEYQYDTTDTLTGFINNDAKVVSKEYPGYGKPQYTSKKITADGKTKIIAKYNLIYSTIFFDANGHGTDTEPIYATPGSAITAPSDPHAEGYIFEGWYTEAECTNKYVFITMPSEDLTIYAKWTPIKYTITWKDGSKVLKTDKVAYDTMPDYGPDPVKQGYEFVSWWPAIQKVTGDATYNAIFFKPLAQYTITWKDWDGKILATTIIDEGDLPKYPGVSKPSRSGYIFTGWTPEIDLASADITYTATYEKKSSGGGGGGGSGSGGGGSSAVIAYAEKPAVTPITVAADGAQMMGIAVVSIPAAQLAKTGLTPVTGIWSKANGMWAFTKADGNKAKNEWALITVAGGNASYFYFDSNGNMVTGWQRVGGKWMYFNNESGSLLGASLRGPGRTPDGYEIDATGAWTGR